MPIVSPNETGFYDPAGLEDENHSYTAFWREDVTWDSPGRPPLVIFDGGGFSTGSGLPISQLDTDADTLQARAYNRGMMVLGVGYSVNPSDNAPTFAFDPAKFQTVTAPDGNPYLALDSTKATQRCAEKDVANFVQYLRFVGIGDADQSSSSGAVMCKSAGGIAAGLPLFSPSMADPNAAAGTRYAMQTRFKAAIYRAPVVTIPGFVGTVALRHWLDSGGSLNATVFDALTAPGGPTTLRYNSILANAVLTQRARQLNATMPVWFGSADPITYGGPYTYADMIGVLPDGHPSEGVLAMQLALEGLSSEFPFSVHEAQSIFRPAQTLTEAEIVEEHYQFMLSALGLDDIEIPYTDAPEIMFAVEDGSGLPNATSYIGLSDAEEYILAFSENPTAWSGLTEAEKLTKLQQASQWIDLVFGPEFVGCKYTKSQGLYWPRTDVVDSHGFSYGVSEIPLVLGKVAAEVAAVAAQNPTSPLGGLTAPILGTSAGATLIEKEVALGPIKKREKFNDAGATSSVGSYATQGAASQVYAKAKSMLGPFLSNYGGWGGVARG